MSGCFWPKILSDVVEFVSSYVSIWEVVLRLMQGQRQELEAAAMNNMQEDIAREVDARRRQLQVHHTPHMALPF